MTASSDSLPIAARSDPDPVTNTEWKQLCDIMNGYIYTQTLVIACDFDLFTYLAQDPGATQEQVSQSLSIRPGLRRTCS